MTMQLDRSLFSDDPAGTLTEVLLAACSAELEFGLDCPSEMYHLKCNLCYLLFLAATDNQKQCSMIISLLIPLMVFAGEDLAGWETFVCGPGKPEASALL